MGSRFTQYIFIMGFAGLILIWWGDKHSVECNNSDLMKSGAAGAGDGVGAGAGQPTVGGETTESDSPSRIQTERVVTVPRNCPVGHFECVSDSSRCVPQSSICNMKADCPDSSDEANCQNQHDKNFWDSLFYKRPGEEVEDLEEVSCKYKFTSNVDDIDGGVGTLGVGVSHGTSPPESKSVATVDRDNDWDSVTEAEWEPDCLCVSEKLFCQNLHLANLSSIPKEVEFLDLSGSHVQLTEFTKLTFPQLDALILSNCFLEEIPPGVFHRLVNLQILHLTSNRLTSIPNGIFVGNTNLHSLFLGYNQLTSLQSDSFAGLTSLRELDLRHNKLSDVPPAAFLTLTSLKKLHLSHNGIKYIPEYFLQGLESLETLSLSSNAITAIHPGVFANSTSLKGLFLSWNLLTVLESRIFCNLRSLLSLNLKDNEIVRIHSDAFTCLERLESLNLERNRFGELDEPRLIFDNLTKLHHIYFDQFWMCWWAPHVRSCEPKGDGISSVENLLDNIILRSCVWLMGLIGVAGNLFVIVSRMVVREPNRVHSFYIKNLALADLLMGVFLLSIAVHDVRFRGEFLSRQHSWRHSLTCQLSGVLSTLSSEASVLILTLITLDRYLSIVRPFAAERSRASIIPAFSIISFLWILSFTLSYLPLSGLFATFFGSDWYSTNGLCLPLHIHNPYDTAWEYSFILFVLINSMAFTFISYAYWKMLRIIQSSSLTIRSTQQKQDTLLAKRFGLVVLTDFLCWAPVIIAKTLAMSGVSIPSTMYAWLAVFVLPVNSALNPIIYTMTTKLFKQQMSKLTVGFRKKLRRGQLDDSTASMSFFRNRTTQRTMTSSFGSSLRHSSVKASTRRTITRTPAQIQMPMMTTGGLTLSNSNSNNNSSSTNPLAGMSGNGNGSGGGVVVVGVGGNGQIHPISGSLVLSSSHNKNSSSSPMTMMTTTTSLSDLNRSSNGSPARAVTVTTATTTLAPIPDDPSSQSQILETEMT